MTTNICAHERTLRRRVEPNDGTTRSETGQKLGGTHSGNIPKFANSGRAVSKSKTPELLTRVMYRYLAMFSSRCLAISSCAKTSLSPARSSMSASQISMTFSYHGFSLTPILIPALGLIKIKYILFRLAHRTSFILSLTFYLVVLARSSLEPGARSLLGDF